MSRAILLTGFVALAAALSTSTVWAQGGKTAKPDVCVDGKCTGEFGTSLHFEPTPKEAAQKARKDEKLVLVLHVSGNFEDPTFT